jgi:hypothetical protein
MPFHIWKGKKHAGKIGKIGCTTSIKGRSGSQKGEYIILEEHTNIYMASRRERILQAEYGYPVDKIPYFKSFKMAKKSHTPEVRARAVENTDYAASRAKIDYAASRAKIDHATSRKKAVANTDYEAQAKKRWVAVKATLEDGTLYGRWDSRKEAIQATGVNDGGIGQCCKNKILFAGKSPNGDKLYWSYA